MTKIITVSFLDDNGTPATALSATIRIRDLSDNSLVITDAAMSEVGDGVYKYSFATYDASKNYAIRCDAGSSISNRYAYATNGADPGGAWEELIANHRTSGSFGIINQDNYRGVGL